MRKIQLGDEEVSLDPANLQFSEANLNEFLCKLPALYAYYSAKWAEAQHLNYCCEDAVEAIFAQKFELYKNQGGSDKLADARASADKEVSDARRAARKTKLFMQEIYGYLRSLDKAHENALNLGYNIRKEMDKLHPGIKRRDFDKELDQILNEEK
jgi:hypothetical protein